jgi:TDG/mug DNA glycosylase family protein
MSPCEKASDVSAPDERLVVHPLTPVFDRQSCVLLLGTMPSPRSREAGFHYGNPHNRFWRVLAALWEEEVPTTIEARRDLCYRHHIALDDVLASCRIAGASDASIRDPVPNDLSRVLDHAPIKYIFCTGTTATRLYRRLIEPVCGIPCVGLPSTSPANARMGLDELICAYAPVRVAAEGSSSRS